MSNELAVRTPASFFMPTTWEDAKNMAIALMASELVPETYRAIPNQRSAAAAMSNCMIALNMANRMQADPLMVMQNLYIVHGRPSFASKFLIGAFNSLGKYSSIDYEFEGDFNSDLYGCRAVATELTTKKVLKGTFVSVDMAKKEGWYARNKKWHNMTEQMLRYRAASFFINTYAPQITCGFPSLEEAEDIKDVSPAPVAEQPQRIKGAYTKVKGVKKPIEAFTPIDNVVDGQVVQSGDAPNPDKENQNLFNSDQPEQNDESLPTE